MPDDENVVQESVAADTARFLCEFCGGPKETEGRRRIKTRRFCSDLCRSRWHERRKTELQGKAERLMAELSAAIRELFDGKRS